MHCCQNKIKSISLSLDEIVKDTRELKLALFSKEFKQWSRLEDAYIKKTADDIFAVLQDLRDCDSRFGYITLLKTELKPYSKYVKGRYAFEKGKQSLDWKMTFFGVGSLAGFYGGSRIAYSAAMHYLPESLTETHPWAVAAAAIIPSMLLLGSAVMVGSGVYRKRIVKNYHKYKSLFEGREVTGMEALEKALK